MLNPYDQENVVKPSQPESLLVQELRVLVKSANPLLIDIALAIFQQTVQIAQRFNRIESITRLGEKTA
jgi:hypothetical protein